MKFFAMTVIVLMMAFVLRDCKAAPTYQELPSRKGYVPVYIQVGDTPLSEINPGLAEAFGEIPSAQDSSKNVSADISTTTSSPSDKKDTSDHINDETISKESANSEQGDELTASLHPATQEIPTTTTINNESSKSSKSSVSSTTELTNG